MPRGKQPTYKLLLRYLNAPQRFCLEAGAPWTPAVEGWCRWGRESILWASDHRDDFVRVLHPAVYEDKLFLWGNVVKKSPEGSSGRAGAATVTLLRSFARQAKRDFAIGPGYAIRPGRVGAHDRFEERMSREARRLHSLERVEPGATIQLETRPEGVPILVSPVTDAMRLWFSPLYTQMIKEFRFGLALGIRLEKCPLCKQRVFIKRQNTRYCVPCRRRWSPKQRSALMRGWRPRRRVRRDVRVRKAVYGKTAPRR